MNTSAPLYREQLALANAASPAGEPACPAHEGPAQEYACKQIAAGFPHRRGRFRAAAAARRHGIGGRSVSPVIDATPGSGVFRRLVGRPADDAPAHMSAIIG